MERSPAAGGALLSAFWWQFFSSLPSLEKNANRVQYEYVQRGRVQASGARAVAAPVAPVARRHALAVGALAVTSAAAGGSSGGVARDARGGGGGGSGALRALQAVRGGADEQRAQLGLLVEARVTVCAKASQWASASASDNAKRLRTALAVALVGERQATHVARLAARERRQVMTVEARCAHSTRELMYCIHETSGHSHSCSSPLLPAWRCSNASACAIQHYTN